MADAFVDIGWNNRELRQGQKEALKIVNDFEKRSDRAFSGKGIDSYAGKLVGVAGGFLSVREAARLAGDSFQAFASFDALVLGLDTITGSATETEAQLERLRDIARNPGLGFREAITGSVRLQSVGFSAQQAERTLAEFGNALALVGGSKVDLKGVVIALGQIAAKGKVSAEEINQIAERLPQIRTAMKDAFGTADTEVLQRRGIGAEEFIEGITDALSGLDRAGSGTKNQLDNISDSLDQAKIAMGRFLDLQQRNRGVLVQTSGILEGLTVQMNRYTDAAEAAGDARALKNIFADIEAGNIAAAREELDKLNNSTTKSQISGFLDAGDFSGALSRLKQIRNEFEATEKVAGRLERVALAYFKGLREAGPIGAFNNILTRELDVQPLEKIPALLDTGDLEGAKLQLQIAVDTAIAADNISDLRLEFARLRESFGDGVDLTVKNNFAELQNSLADMVQTGLENKRIAAETAVQQKAAAEEAARQAKGQESFNKSLQAIEKIQFDLLPSDQALAQLRGKLKDILEAQNVLDVKALSKLIEKAVNDGDYDLASAAGKNLIEAKKVQDEINRLAEANVTAEKAEEVKRLAEEQYRIESEIFRLRMRGNNAAADAKEQELEAQREIAELQERAGITQAKAAELVKERQAITKKIADDEAKSAKELWQAQNRIIILKSKGDFAGAAKLQQEIAVKQKALEIQKQMNVSYDQALHSAQALQDAEAKTKQDALQKELEIMRARASGNTGKADQLQEELDIQQEALRLQEEYNYSAEKALEIAKEKASLREAERNNQLKSQDFQEDGRRKIKFRDGVEKRRSFLGIDGSQNFPGLDDKTFKGLDELAELKKKAGSGFGLLDKAASQAAQNNQPTTNVEVQPQNQADQQIVNNTDRIAVAVEKLGAQ